MLKRLLIIAICSISAFSYAEVKPFELVDVRDTSIKNIKARAQIWISSPEANNKQDRIDTIEEALFTAISSYPLDVVTIFMMPGGKSLVGTGYYTATLNYDRERCQNPNQLSKSCYGVSAYPQQLTPRQIKVAELTYEFYHKSETTNPEYLNKDRVPDEAKLKKYIAKKLNISEKQAKDEFIMLSPWE